jgi:hypothetical protein
MALLKKKFYTAIIYNLLETIFAIVIKCFACSAKKQSYLYRECHETIKDSRLKLD